MIGESMQQTKKWWQVILAIAIALVWWAFVALIFILEEG